MPIKFQCLVCLKELTAPDEAAGRIGKCPRCGEGLRVPQQYAAVIPSLEPTREVQGETVSQVRPWVRYWARLTDYYLFALVSGVILAVIAPSVDIPELLLSVLIFFFWVFAEASLLSTWGTTPGKWLLRTKVRNSMGQKLTFSTALLRSFSVWWRGVGAGIPIVTFITLIISHGKLKKDGHTPWDREGGFSISHERIGIIRVTVTILLFIGLGFLIALGEEPEEVDWTQRQPSQKPFERFAFDETKKTLATKPVPQIYREVSKAVVAILVMYNWDEDWESPGYGSGFVFNSDGLIATNYHLIEDAFWVLVVTESGIIYEGQGAVVTDPKRDIAIIKINASYLPIVKLGNSDHIRIGDKTFAISNPQGYQNTVTDGIVSNRWLIEQYFEMLQITAPISPGSSGGAVLDNSGEVIAIICGADEEGQNLNFAIPINYLKELITQVTPSKIRRMERTFLTSPEPIDGRHIDDLLRE